MWPAWKCPAHQNHLFCTASISNGVCICLDTRHSIVFLCVSLNKTTFVVPAIFGSSRQRGVWRSGGFGSHNTGGVLKEQEFGQTNSACSVYTPANIYNVSNDSLSSTDRTNVGYWFLYAIILIELNEKNSFVKSSLENFPRLMTQKGERQWKGAVGWETTEECGCDFTAMTDCLNAINFISAEERKC